MSSGCFCLFVLGRLHGVTRERMRRTVEELRGRLVRDPSSKVTLVGIGHSSASVALAAAPPLALPPELPRSARAISEINLKRLLGLHPPHADQNRELSANEVSQGARLDPEVIRCLALYDVLEPVSDRFGYRDLVAAREVRRLLDLGLGLARIVEAAVQVRRSGRSLADTRLSTAPWGEVVQEVAGRLGRLDGQYALSLDECFEPVDRVFERAERAEMDGDLALAERHYARALDMDRSDPVLPFNLGNVLDALGRPKEAALAYQRSITRDPTFAEGWLNLAVLYERRNEVAQAGRCYEEALRARPGYPEAVFNLASLLMGQSRFGDAVPLWEAYLDVKPTPSDAPKAHKLLALCRMYVQSQRVASGSR